MRNSFKILFLSFIYLASGSLGYSQNGVGVNTSTPSSTFEDNGSFGKKVTTITTSTAFDQNYVTIICNNVSTAINVTLPTTSRCVSRLYEIKRNNTNTAIVLIVGTINGATNLVLTLVGQYITIFSDGINWLTCDGSSSYWSFNQSASSYKNLGNASVTTIGSSRAVSLISDGCIWKRFH